MDADTLQCAIDYYRAQGAPQDQQMLSALLHEAQELNGCVLCEETLESIAQELHIKPSMLDALIRCIPTLHMAHAPRQLEMCHHCIKSRSLAAFVEREYGAKAGTISEKGHFVLAPVSCMKSCKTGASIRWNGKLYTNADENFIRSLID